MKQGLIDALHMTQDTIESALAGTDEIAVMEPAQASDPSVLTARIRNIRQLRSHCQRGHLPYSVDCNHCIRSYGKLRPHYRQKHRYGGELSLDIARPTVEGHWPSDVQTSKKV